MAGSRLISVLERSRDLGFLGPVSIEEQVTHATAYADALRAAGLKEPTHAIDLGSGGGLPGLVLAGIWESTNMILLDGSVRRCTFLEESVEDLQLGRRVSIRCGRAEELARDPDLRGWADLVVARSFGAPPVLAECAAGFLGVNGHLLVSEPPDGTGDRWPEGPLALLGMGPVTSIAHDPNFALIEQVSPCPERYPRRVGVPSKRPLF
jgi:16S rRNA (guanine527-N7)-methyltransferase